MILNGDNVIFSELLMINSSYQMLNFIQPITALILLSKFLRFEFLAVNFLYFHNKNLENLVCHVNMIFKVNNNQF